MAYPSKTVPYEMRKLGAYLTQLREEGNFSVRQVARECSISPSYLFKIEKGDSFTTISLHTLLKLSKFYNVPIGALLKEVDLIDRDEYDLPDLPQYLRAKYHLSPQAIKDMEMAKKIVDEKHKR